MNAPPIAMMDQLDQPIAKPGQLPADIMEALQNANSMEEIEAVSSSGGHRPSPPRVTRRPRAAASQPMRCDERADTFPALCVGVHAWTRGLSSVC